MAIDNLTIKLDFDTAELEKGAKRAEESLSVIDSMVKKAVNDWQRALEKSRKAQEEVAEQPKSQGQKDWEKILEATMKAKTPKTQEKAFSKAYKNTFAGLEGVKEYSKKLDMAWEAGLFDSKEQQKGFEEIEKRWEKSPIEAKDMEEVAKLDKLFADKMPEGIKRLEEELEAAKQKAKEAAKAMKSVGKETEKVDDAATKMGKSVGSKLGGLIGGAIKRFVLPLLAGLSLGSFFNSFSSDVKQVAQMTGYYTGQMDEWYKKRAMLARVTRQDLELYRRSKFAVLNFNIALADLSSNIMHRLTPTFLKGLDLLERFTAWIGRNENNIIRFVTVVAGVLTVMMLPALVKAAAGAWAFILPWLPLIAVITLIVLVIDDFITMCQGGESGIVKMSQAIKRIAPQIVDTVKGVVGKIKEWVDGLLDSVKAVWNAIIDWLGELKNMSVIEIFNKMVSWAKEKAEKTDEKAKSGELLEETAEQEGFDPQIIPPVEVVTKGAVPASVTNSQNVKGDTNINISNVTVETRATNADDVAKGFVGGVEKATSDKFSGMPLTPAADGGVR